MRIKKLLLRSNELAAQEQFYKGLGFDTELQVDALIIQAGDSVLQFRESADFKPYHFCFLIPAVQIKESLAWLKTKLEPLQSNQEGPIYISEPWNAKSIYFYDGDGNILEFIARFDLNDASSKPFSVASIINVNEIGLPTHDIARTNSMLSEALGTSFWKGNTHRFGTNGDQYGLFLLVNPNVKENWFPTNQSIHFSPFEAVIESKDRNFRVEYSKSNLEIISLS